MLRTKPRSANGLPAEEEEALSTKAIDGTSGDVAVPSPSAPRLNPRTGKPLSMPNLLSLSPHPMSPIVDELDAAPVGGQLVHEEHEEVKLVQTSSTPRLTRADNPAARWRTTRTYKDDDSLLRQTQWSQCDCWSYRIG